MATTSGNLVVSKALAGRGGNGNGSKGKGSKGKAAALVATAALGLSLMVGGILGQGRQAGQGAAATANTGPFTSSSHVATMWDFREDRRAETRDLFIVDQFTYREDRRVGAAQVGTLDWEQQERTQMAPGLAGCVHADSSGLSSEGCGGGGTVDRVVAPAAPSLPLDPGLREYLPGETRTSSGGVGLPSPDFGPQP